MAGSPWFYKSARRLSKSRGAIWKAALPPLWPLPELLSPDSCSACVPVLFSLMMSWESISKSTFSFPTCFGHVITAIVNLRHYIIEKNLSLLLLSG